MFPLLLITVEVKNTSKHVVMVVVEMVDPNMHNKIVLNKQTNKPTNKQTNKKQKQNKTKENEKKIEHEKTEVTCQASLAVTSHDKQ